MAKLNFVLFIFLQPSEGIFNQKFARIFFSNLIFSRINFIWLFVYKKLGNNLIAY